MSLSELVDEIFPTQTVTIGGDRLRDLEQLQAYFNTQSARDTIDVLLELGQRLRQAQVKGEEPVFVRAGTSNITRKLFD